jgi:hypothetical protein
MKRTGLVLILLLIAALACQFSFSTAKIKSATMTQDSAGQTETSVYGPQDTFYCVIQLGNAADDTQTKAVWSVVQAEGLEPGYKIDEVEIEHGSGTIIFTLPPPNPWPVGQYQVDIFLNGTKKGTMTFNVQ